MNKSNLYVILFRFATMSKNNFQICGKKSHTNVILLQSQKWSVLPLTTIHYNCLPVHEYIEQYIWQRNPYIHCTHHYNGLCYIRLEWKISLWTGNTFLSGVPFLVLSLFTNFLLIKWRYVHLDGTLLVVGVIMNRVTNQFRGRWISLIHPSADYQL